MVPLLLLHSMQKKYIKFSIDIDYKKSFFFHMTDTIVIFFRKICHEKDGGYFGEAALIYPDRRRLETAIALEVCELLRLDRRDFKRMFTVTSTFYKRLEKVAKERYELITKLGISSKDVNLEPSTPKQSNETSQEKEDIKI